MEKKELLKELYDLRRVLLILAVKCDEVNKKILFEEKWNSKHGNKNYFDYDDEDFVLFYETNCKLAFEFPTKPKKGYGWSDWLWENMIEMYDLNPTYEPLIRLRRETWNYLNPIKNGNTDMYLSNDIEKKYNEAYNTFKKDAQIYERMLAAFVNNINFHQYRKKVLLDAKSNKNSPYFMDYIDKKKLGIFARKKAAKEIDDILKQVERDIKFFEKDNKKDEALMKQKYMTCSVRTKAEIKADEQALQEVKEASKILEKKYSFISKADWEDIDALIFFLESGRADTLKEALNLNDMKKYKDEIVASVDRVNRTVIKGIITIRRDLNVYFNTLFVKLDALNDSLINIAGEIAKNTEAIHYSSKQICQSIEKATR